MNTDTAQLYVPLIDFLVRWELFNDEAKQACRHLISTSGLDNKTFSVVDKFLDDLDVAQEG